MMKLSKKERILFDAAYVRYLKYHNGAPVDGGWFCGSGKPSEYKSLLKKGLMIPVYPEQPYKSAWYRLTSEGASVLQEYIDNPPDWV